MQIRSVECHDSHGSHNTQCEPSTRPPSVQSCSTGISCTSEMPATDDFDETFSKSPIEANLDDNENFERNDDVTEEEEDENENVQEPKTSKSAPKSLTDNDETEEDEDESDMQGDEPQERHRKIPLAYQYRIPRAERLVDPNAPNEPT